MNNLAVVMYTVDQSVRRVAVRKVGILLLGLFCVVIVSGCTSPAKKVKSIELGMTAGEVLERMGEPYTVRAAHSYADGKVVEIWEYVSPTFTFNPRTFLVIFEDDQLVRWGLEEDLSGGSAFGN